MVTLEYADMANSSLQPFKPGDTIRIPERLLAANTIKPYCPNDPATMRKANGFVILDYSRAEGEDENDDGQGWMASLSPLRTELMRGDRRPLYLG